MFEGELIEAGLLRVSERISEVAEWVRIDNELEVHIHKQSQTNHEHDEVGHTAETALFDVEHATAHEIAEVEHGEVHHSLQGVFPVQFEFLELLRFLLLQIFGVVSVFEQFVPYLRKHDEQVAERNELQNQAQVEVVDEVVGTERELGREGRRH